MMTPSQPHTSDDPILSEIRKARDEMARDANYDIHALCERLREAERQHPERLIEAPTLQRSLK